jgi:hypothetical protein
MFDRPRKEEKRTKKLGVDGGKDGQRGKGEERKEDEKGEGEEWRRKEKEKKGDGVEKERRKGGGEESGRRVEKKIRMSEE